MVNVTLVRINTFQHCDIMPLAMDVNFHPQKITMKVNPTIQISSADAQETNIIKGIKVNIIFNFHLHSHCIIPACKEGYTKSITKRTQESLVLKASGSQNAIKTLL